MSIYVIGDLQGCYDELQQLLEQIQFDATADTLWFVGDLVNRGPLSLECLRFVKSLEQSAITVLGNHDLSLLATAEGFRKTSRNDTLDTILEAPDRDELLYWLRQQPLLHHDRELSCVMTHAGLAIQWSVPQAVALAKEVTDALRGPDYRLLLENMYGNTPSNWSDSLTGFDRLRFVINACTRMRYCSQTGALDLTAKGAPGSQAKGLLPWYELYPQAQLRTRIVFGHWSTLGAMQYGRIYSLDSGCVWGGQLSALKLDLDSCSYTSISCRIKKTPGKQPL